MEGKRVRGGTKKYTSHKKQKGKEDYLFLIFQRGGRKGVIAFLGSCKSRVVERSFWIMMATEFQKLMMCLEVPAPFSANS